MSYATQDGDKFYLMNPKDAQDGDEIFIAQKWRDWQEFCDDPLTCSIHKVRYRRRLIAPGEGWRILGVGHSLPERFEFTTDGMTWLLAIVPDCELQTISTWITKDVIAIRQRIPAVPVESNTGQSNLSAPPMPTSEPVYNLPSHIQAVIDAAREYVSSVRNGGTKPKSFTILESSLAALGEPMEQVCECGHERAIHNDNGCVYEDDKQMCTCTQFKPKEPTKDDEWPRYWLWRNTNLHRQNADGSSDSWLPSAKWKRSVHMNFDFSAPSYKRLTPAEAQARMEGNDTKPDAALLKAFKESGLRSTAASTHNDRLLVFSAGWNAATKPPVQDELRELLERVKERITWLKEHYFITEIIMEAREIQRWIEDAMKGRKP